MESEYNGQLPENRINIIERIIGYILLKDQSAGALIETIRYMKINTFTLDQCHPSIVSQRLKRRKLLLYSTDIDYVYLSP